MTRPPLPMNFTASLTAATHTTDIHGLLAVECSKVRRGIASRARDEDTSIQCFETPWNNFAGNSHIWPSVS
jgi:hypothetical protein